MLSSEQEKFLVYYHRELTYLRQAGRTFSVMHPKVARRLQLSSQESPDPHTERLLESFAFMAARLHQEIDDRLPQISSALLGILYPQLTAPVPSMAIAQFVGDPSQGKLTTGAHIPKHTALYANSHENVNCRFQTAYPVTLWPIEVVAAEFTQADEYAFYNCTRQSPWYLKIKLKTLGVDFSDLDLQSLRFFIHGDNRTRFRVYDMLFAQENSQVLTSVKDNELRELVSDSVHPVGFKVTEGILPAPSHSHPAYQLIHEYFHFPEKYLFFDVRNLKLREGDEYAEILLSLDNPRDVDKLIISKENFRLGCTPIVNLFPKVTDPLRLNHQKFEYRLVPDQRRERTTEIYSINKISLTQDESDHSETLVPYFSYDHESYQSDHKLYWLSRRVPSDKRDIPGTDIYLSFVDLAFNPKRPASEIVFAHTLCTNRFLGEQVPEGGILQPEETFPTERIICLTRPTTQAYSPQDGETLWKLVAQLSINHLSISAGNSALKALKETLRLYAGSVQEFSHREIDALHTINSYSVTRRLGNEAWRGFVNGLHVDLTVEERVTSGESIFLLASVLRHFFALQASGNSFIELNLKSLHRESEWMSWKPLHGEQIIL